MLCSLYFLTEFKRSNSWDLCISVNFYWAMLRIERGVVPWQVVCSSVRPSVTLIGLEFLENNFTTISLTYLLPADSDITDLLQKEHTKF